MSDAVPRRTRTPRFSLLNLLISTAVISLGTAVGLAYRKNVGLIAQRDALLSLSSRLLVEDQDKLAMAQIPRVADDYYSWQVYVPEGDKYELRLGIGTVSQNEVPAIANSIPLTSGQHRITLFTGDSPREEFRYQVFVDGTAVIEETMGSQWLPEGWSSASSLQWPDRATVAATALQLSGKSYTERANFGRQHYFNGQSDDYVTRKGYRLWIDKADMTYAVVSPFTGFLSDPGYVGIGLRDGLRLKLSERPRYNWAITRPMLATTDPIVQIIPEFIASDETGLTGDSATFQAWMTRSEATGDKPLSWEADRDQQQFNAYLHATHKAVAGLHPVVEFKWDAARPNEVGFRLVDTPKNDSLVRWRLRIVDGSHHLWREVRLGSQSFSASDLASQVPEGQIKTFSPPEETNTDNGYVIEWQTDEKLPLQIVERTQPQYAGMGLYSGLPATFGLDIPVSLTPAVSTRLVTEVEGSPGTPFPGGAVFGEIAVDLDATKYEWIWLRAQAKQ